MNAPYNLYNLEALFKEYLLAGNNRPVSIKNYLSDFRHFAGWITFYLKSDIAPFNKIDSHLIQEYKFYLCENKIPLKTINRRLSTIRKFCSFCISQGWMKENPAKHVSNVLLSRATLSERSESKGSRGTDHDILQQFKQDLINEKLDQTTITNYLNDVQEFLSV